MTEVFGHLLFLDLSFFQNYTYINYREMAGAKYVCILRRPTAAGAVTNGS